MNLFQEAQHRQLQLETRRHFLKKCTSGMGVVALGSLMGCEFGSSSAKPAAAAVKEVLAEANPMAAKMAHFAARAKRVIYLHMAGSPSQLELFDYKPELAKLHNKDCPPSLLERQTLRLYPGRAQDARSAGYFCEVRRVRHDGIGPFALLLHHRRRRSDY